MTGCRFVRIKPHPSTIFFVCCYSVYRHNEVYIGEGTYKDTYIYISFVAVGCMSCRGWVHVLQRLGACLVAVGCMSCCRMLLLSRSDISRNSLIFPEAAVDPQKQSHISRNGRIFSETVVAPSPPNPSDLTG